MSIASTPRSALMVTVELAIEPFLDLRVAMECGWEVSSRIGRHWKSLEGSGRRQRRVFGGVK